MACEDIPSTDQCSFVKDNCESNSIFNIFTLFYCDFNANMGYLIVIIIILAVCFYILGSTADDYMSPALVTISQKLGMSPNLAGVTLLTFGNGAPDLISSFAAASNNQVQMAIGALCGAGIFVTCIVVGACVTAMVKEEKLPLSLFLRDITYYALAVLLLGMCSFWGYFHLVFGLLSLFIYAIFVIQVLCQEKKAQEFQRSQSETLLSDDQSEVKLQDIQNENFLKMRSDSLMRSSSEASLQSEPSFQDIEQPLETDQ